MQTTIYQPDRKKLRELDAKEATLLFRSLLNADAGRLRLKNYRVSVDETNTADDVTEVAAAHHAAGLRRSNEGGSTMAFMINRRIALNLIVRAPIAHHLPRQVDVIAAVRVPHKQHLHRQFPRLALLEHLLPV